MLKSPLTSVLNLKKYCDILENLIFNSQYICHIRTRTYYYLFTINSGGVKKYHVDVSQLLSLDQLIIMIDFDWQCFSSKRGPEKKDFFIQYVLLSESDKITFRYPNIFVFVCTFAYGTDFVRFKNERLYLNMHYIHTINSESYVLIQWCHILNFNN